jgi:uncharacterized protein
MQLQLKKRPKNPVIIEGFPGFGLVGTIATEFLVKHLDAEQIGFIRMDEVPPVIAVHQGKPVEPLSIFYSKKYNLIVLHALSSVQGYEWELAELLRKLSKELKAKEVISLEGVGSPEQKQKGAARVFFTGKNGKKLKNYGAQPLHEGIIMGVTGALLLKKDMALTCLFAETHSNLPDSRAAAKLIEILDKYLGLKVDYKPLIEKADRFEGKIKDLMKKTQSATIQQAEKKKQSYFG